MTRQRPATGASAVANGSAGARAPRTRVLDVSRRGITRLRANRGAPMSTAGDRSSTAVVVASVASPLHRYARMEVKNDSPFVEISGEAMATVSGGARRARTTGGGGIGGFFDGIYKNIVFNIGGRMGGTKLAQKMYGKRMT